ncbi:uncharacterized protein LAESUDRAFT_756294 [Laetiporus sulphureus 93-53]|uniref:Glycosyltransferase family 2 protein n=1 Tax=Laetiporus sulphureus 93-53 TaxID=1314785 RepID=A0A165GB20_9APHY|nr:uncharacterized protein LAESUDRAFT_756294 [Laetiporus sulphureus 93-53]KZT10097.1 hypothetical protein LAESUDRAFT_756294 [Laetiporus sulphureus 93-53]
MRSRDADHPEIDILENAGPSRQAMRHGVSNNVYFHHVQDGLNVTSNKTTSSTALILDLCKGNTDTPELLSLTAVLPVVPSSLGSLETQLRTLLEYSRYLSDILITYPAALQSQIRRSMLSVLASGGHSAHVEMSLSTWPSGTDEATAVFHVAQQAATTHVLLLGSDGLETFDDRTKEILLLLEPFSTMMPLGPRGLIGNACVTPSETPQKADYLLPPFLLPTSLLPLEYFPAYTWKTLGERMSQTQPGLAGGLVVGSSNSSSAGCSQTVTSISEEVLPDIPMLADDYSLQPVESLGTTILNDTCVAEYDRIPLSGTFMLLLDSTADLRSFSSAACRLQTDGHEITTVVRSSESDLVGRGDFDVDDWHVPRVDISVITNDRPHSLERLLTSLSSARYFGDALNLRVNMEQTADPETLQVVNVFRWNYGQVFLHRRVIHGGLLPAVVESWYPHSNNSYGLILEDDVEVSPLFYAWIKMALLRYRYGQQEDRSSQLFGISLYQQKNLELRPDGRHPFNARNAFAAVGIANPNTPYLSQIPCSWGAVYFPEHWKEFHSYLSFRLSEYAWDTDQVVIPGARSNKWTRSWKKYFIELVYLRGYIMLYPNFDDYVSLSTNHLEIGSHVKNMSTEAYLRKKRMFLLPLMELPSPEQASGLLDLPNGRLPSWSSLPSLDLLGLPVDEKAMIQRGLARKAELTGCDEWVAERGIPSHDVWDLLCDSDQLFHHKFREGSTGQ